MTRGFCCDSSTKWVGKTIQNVFLKLLYRQECSRFHGSWNSFWSKYTWTEFTVLVKSPTGLWMCLKLLEKICWKCISNIYMLHHRHAHVTLYEGIHWIKLMIIWSKKDKSIWRQFYVFRTYCIILSLDFNCAIQFYVWFCLQNVETTSCKKYCKNARHV